MKKDIEGAIENVNLIYANQYTLDGSTQVEEKNKQIKIENYKEEVSLNKGKNTIEIEVEDEDEDEYRIYTLYIYIAMCA